MLSGVEREVNDTLKEGKEGKIQVGVAGKEVQSVVVLFKSEEGKLKED